MNDVALTQIFFSEFFSFLLSVSFSFLFRIREVPGPNLGFEIGYSKRFRGLPPTLQANAEIVP
jgi:hypothetical protein